MGQTTKKRANMSSMAAKTMIGPLDTPEYCNVFTLVRDALHNADPDTFAKELANYKNELEILAYNMEDAEHHGIAFASYHEDYGVGRAVHRLWRVLHALKDVKWATTARLQIGHVEQILFGVPDVTPEVVCMVLRTTVEYQNAEVAGVRFAPKADDVSRSTALAVQTQLELVLAKLDEAVDSALDRSVLSNETLLSDMQVSTT